MAGFSVTSSLTYRGRNERMINRYAVWKVVLTSWGITILGLLSIAFFLFVAGFIVIRFAGPGAVVALIVPAMAFSMLIFLTGEVIVNTIFRAEAPHPQKDARFIRAMQSVTKKAGMWFAPRGWIVNIGGAPNAMAYGPGIPGMCAVGVSRPLVEMLDDEELEAVLAHEFGHIRCRDTGILAVIGLIVGFFDKFRKILGARQSIWLQNPITIVLGWIIYGLGRAAFYVSQFSISQERELAADALSASYMKDARPLIRALKKLHAHGAANRTDGDKPFMSDLMVAHPGLEERIASLESVMKEEKEKDNGKS